MMELLRRLLVCEVGAAVALTAFGDWWAARAANRLKAVVKFITQTSAQ